jgi:hypothetical protein
MRNKEMSDETSRLTWSNVLDLLAKHNPEGLTNNEIAEELESEYRDTAALTRIMFNSRSVSRMTVGKTAGTSFYFLPVVPS